MGLKEMWQQVTGSSTAFGRELKNIGPEEIGGRPQSGSVNFMDGERRSRPNNTADVYQTEFKKYAGAPDGPGTNILGGAQGTVPATNDKTYPLSRWTPVALNIAFDGSGPPTLGAGFYNTNRFRIKRAGLPVAEGDFLHKYVPAGQYNASSVGGYINKFDIARSRYTARPTSNT